MKHDELLKQMTDAVVNGQAAEAETLARKGVSLGIAPGELIDRGFVPGTRQAGRLWEAGDYFLPELVSSAEAMKVAMGVLQPELEKTASRGGGRAKSRAVIGTGG